MQRGASIKKYSSIQGGAGLFVSVGALVASAFLAFGLVAKLSNNLFPWLSGKTLRVVGCPNLPFFAAGLAPSISGSSACSCYSCCWTGDYIGCCWINYLRCDTSSIFAITARLAPENILQKAFAQRLNSTLPKCLLAVTELH